MKFISFSWVNLDSDSSRSDGERTSAEISVKENPKQFEQRIGSLQLQVPPSSTCKVTAFNAIVDLVKDSIPTKVLEGTGIFEPQAEHIEQLQWH